MKPSIKFDVNVESAQSFLTAIRLANFKCFKTLKLRCPKITLLTGANSSGKSSVFASLLGALQTHDFPFTFAPNGSLITLGDYRDIVTDHDPNNSVSVGFDLGPSENPVSVDAVFGHSKDTDLPQLDELRYASSGFNLSIERQSKAKGSYTCQYKEIPRSDGDDLGRDELRGIVKDFVSKLDATIRAKMIRDGKLDHKDQEDIASVLGPVGSGQFDFASREEFWMKASEKAILLQECSDIPAKFRRFEDRFNFISPFRLPPERTYYQKAKKAMKVDRFGDNCIDQVLEWESRKDKKIEKLKSVLAELGLVDDVVTKKFEGGRYEVRIKAPRRKSTASICDVGFGVSQFLPILVADLQMGSNSTLMVSQPEIHLHPSVQAQLANYFMDQSQASGKRYLIETHSDYLLTRFRLLIAQNKLKPEDVAVYHFSPFRGYTRMDEILFKTDGTIDGAPKDYFETYLNDVMSIALSV